MNAYGLGQFNSGQLDMIIIEQQFFFSFTSPKMNSIQHEEKRKKPSLESRLPPASQRLAFREWGRRATVGTGAQASLRLTLTTGLQSQVPQLSGSCHPSSVQLSPKPRSGLVSGSSDFFQVGEKFTFWEGFSIDRHIPSRLGATFLHSHRTS